MEGGEFERQMALVVEYSRNDLGECSKLPNGQNSWLAVWTDGQLGAGRGDAQVVVVAEGWLAGRPASQAGVIVAEEHHFFQNR